MRIRFRLFKCSAKRLIFTTIIVILGFCLGKYILLERMPSDNRYQQHDPSAFLNQTFKCPPDLSFGRGLPRTALYSFPGSGNTWVRHLLQQATGIYTGTIYIDYQLRYYGFKGEGHAYYDVIAVKTHTGLDNERALFKRCIMILRNPYHAIWAEFNRLRTDHVGIASAQARANINVTEIEELTLDWRISNLAWIQDERVPLHIIRYDKLKSDLAGELQALMRFLQWPFSKRRLECVLRHSEGRQHRHQVHPVPDNLFTESQRLYLNTSIVEVETAIRVRQARERRLQGWLYYFLLPAL